jgi:hypothetical protein
MADGLSGLYGGPGQFNCAAEDIYCAQTRAQIAEDLLSFFGFKPTAVILKLERLEGGSATVENRKERSPVRPSHRFTDFPAALRRISSFPF